MRPYRQQVPAEQQDINRRGPVLALPAPRAAVTHCVFLDLALDRKAAGRFTIGLFGEEAPVSVKAFANLCAGSLIGRPNDEPASYRGSTLVRIERGKFIVGGTREVALGTTKPIYRPVEPAQNSDTGAGKHDAPGLVSMRKGGNDVEYVITLGQNGPSTIEIGS